MANTMNVTSTTNEETSEDPITPKAPDLEVEEETSLHDILDDDCLTKEDDDRVLQDMLQEALGITSTGTCRRHTNCPVVTGLANEEDLTRVISCRVCFVEEKSVGIKPPKTTFANVIQQLHRQVDEEQLSQSQAAIFHNSLNLSGSFQNVLLETSERDNSSSGAVEECDVVKCNTASKLLAFLQQDASAMEFVMKRLSQVQNWALRHKEQQVVKLQLHCKRLEKQVAELLHQSNEQRSTIQSLRRSIQQDLKVIKTFAKQQQIQEEAAEEMYLIQKEQKLQLQQLDTSDHVLSQQPLTQYQASPATAAAAKYNMLKHSPDQQSGPNSSESTPVDEIPFTRSTLESKANRNDVDFFVTEDSEQNDSATAEAEARKRRSFYWNGDEHKHQSSRNIFQSFRGGLLDIPKSPPRVRHDRDMVEGIHVERKKLQLNQSAMNALQLPERALSRSNSATVDKTTTSISTSRQKPLNAMANKMIEQCKLLDSPEYNSGKSINRSEEKFLPSAPTLTDDHCNSGTNTTNTIQSKSSTTIESHENATKEKERTCVQDIISPTNNLPLTKGSSKVATGTKVFDVAKATCQDKFGDEGIYTGSIVVAEGLPHGHGKMEYESGRVYDGEWVSGQWHGKGKLLNPNGDSYEGEFFFDARHGYGVYKWDNGDMYVGQFVSDKRHGKGKFHFHNGNVYEGEFCDGMFEGFGRYDFTGGYYEGEWKEGRYDGSGELQYANGGKYTGEFRQSVAHGFGMEVLPDGSKRRGVWENGEPTDFSGK